MNPRRARGVALGAMALVAVLLPSPASAQSGDTTELVVTLVQEGNTVDILDDAGIGGATAVTPLVAEVWATPEQAAALRADPRVEAVERPITYHITALPNDPCITGCSGVRTWYLEQLGVPEGWTRGTGAGVEIAVVDGGVEMTEPDLAGKIVDEIDYVGAPGAISHGTAVASLAAAVTDNGVGIPGMARDARIRSFKVVGAGGTATETDVAHAIRDATDLGSDVINLSLTGGDSSAIDAEIDRAISLGVAVVAAAGNLTRDPNTGGYLPQDSSQAYPARHAGVIAVGASTPDNQAADFSFRGSWVDVFAPGLYLAVPYAPGSGYASFSGTSGATPIVSGAVAMLRSSRPTLTPAQIEDWLRETAVPLGDGSTGERRIDVATFMRGPDPIGSLDVASAGPGQVTVKGWALDPNTADPIQVHVYVDASGYATTASTTRTDVGAVFPGYGSAHGFVTTVPASAGTRQVCAYGINVGPGASQLLGCRSVQVGGSPLGALDIARQVPGGVQVAGWSLDLDVADPIDVHAYAGSSGAVTSAGRSRADIGSAFPAWGPNHGYLTTIPTSASGSTSICTYGINVGLGSNAVLGCRSVELRQNPFGTIDSVVRSGDTVRLRGWALDPSSGTSIQVHLYASSGGAVAGNANLERADLGPAFPGYGTGHGFDVQILAPPGAQLCLYAINVGAGGNALLGCRAAP